MMGTVGTIALVLALFVAAVGTLAASVGAKRRSRALIESARTSAYSLFVLSAAANWAMLAAIVNNDFSIAYVAENSSRATPLFFKILSLWSADEGSLLLWNLVLAGFIAAVAYRFRTRWPQTFPWALAVMFATAVFYLALVVWAAPPFEALASVPRDGAGPLPLLQNHPLMAAHPPTLYLGFIGLTVPFAFAIAALITGRLDESWIRLTRRWMLVSWSFLAAGLLLGALWSYGVLGWGGYWAWDPVENVALLPWLTATAFLHSVMAQERRGVLKVWNLSLVVMSYALATFATFLTRGSILASVHAFAQSLVGPLYLGFLILVLLVGFGLIAARARLLRSHAHFDSVLARESAFLGNNLLLAIIAFTVLLGTIYPLLVEALSRTRVSVGAPYFDRTTIPAALLLLFLVGIGPLLAWRATSWRILQRRLQLPAALAGATALAVALSGTDNVAALLAFATATFALVATGGEVWRSVGAHREAAGGSITRAVWRAVRGNPRFYGGLLAHVGLIVAAVAIAASASFQRQAEFTLGRGETKSAAGYAFTYEGTRELQQPHRRVVIAQLALTSGDGREMTMVPSVNYYPRSKDGIGTPSIRVGTPANGFTDVYASIRSIGSGDRATFHVYVNPGVMWLWAGGALLVAGGAVAAWPRRRARQRPERLPHLEESRGLEPA